MDIKTFTQSEGLSFYLKIAMYSPVFRFINDLSYKSDEMAHIAFLDERYNKHKLTTTCRDRVLDTPHVNYMFLWNYCERSSCETHIRNLHAFK